MNVLYDFSKGWKFALSIALLTLGGMLSASSANAQKLINVTPRQNVLSIQHTQQAKAAYTEDEQTKGPLMLIQISTIGYYGINMDVSDVKANQKFNIAFGYLYCYADEGFEGTFHICLTDKDGKVKEDYGGVGIEMRSSSYLRSVQNYTLEPETTAESGDRIALFSQATGSDELIPIKGEDNEDISIPATGYTPRTSDVVITADEGATVESIADYNILYQGKPLLGWNYAFSVTPKERTSKCFVTVDDDFQESAERLNFCEDEAEGDSRTYIICNMSKSSYDINVKTYQNYEEKELDLEVTPGNLIDALREKKPDFNVYRLIKVKGQIDMSDFTYLNYIPFRKIDLSECTVAAYKGNDADCVPMLAFQGNVTLDEVLLPKGVKEIGYGAFMSTYIKKITIPASVEKVDRYAFYNNTGLLDVYMEHTTPLSYDSNTFNVVSSTIAKRTLHVPAGSKSAYEDGDNQAWTQYFGKIVEDVETGVQGITIDASDAAAKYKNQKKGIFDLNGRRILTPVKNQTYIQGGKKFIQR